MDQSKRQNIPEIEFDSCDPGILSGVVVLDSRPGKSSILAGNVKYFGVIIKFYGKHATLLKKYLQNLSIELEFCKPAYAKHIRFRCSFSCGHNDGSLSMAKSYK